MAETYVNNILPQNDEDRLKALQRYKITDVQQEESFNNIAHLMADVFDVPIALVSLVDKHRVLFKGNVGMPGVKHTDRSISLCSFAILSSEPTIFDKPLEEPCLLSNPLVHGSFGLRFYAGAPLTTPDGFHIGSVCILDKKERTFSSKQQEMLVRFSRLVMHDIELRRSALLQHEAEADLIKSKERFELVAKATQDAIWDWDLITNLTWWNDGFKELFGYSNDDIEPTIQSWTGRVHPDDKERVVNGIHGVINNGGTNWSAEYRFRRKDGTYAIVFDRGYALHNPKGRPYRMLGSMQDITKRKRLEEATKQSEARTRLAVEAAHLGTFEINVAEQSIIHSPRTAEIIGLDPTRQWPYQTFLNSLHPEDRTIREKAHEAARRTGKLFYEARVILPNETIRWIRINGVLLNKESASILIGTKMDITEEKRAAESLEQKIEERTHELQQVNDQLKQFTYAASHDLQEPLRKISFFLSRLLSSIGPALSEENRRNAERIEHTTERMRSLIDDLLAYSNTTLGITRFKEVDLTCVLKEVLEDMDVTITEKSARIDVQQLPRIKGDQRQLRQLFQNLVANALKYQKDGETPHVQISSRFVDNGEVQNYIQQEQKKVLFHQIQVKDNGIGFHPDDAERIFRLFQRLHGKAEFPGTGVGLAIAQKVVENHGGYIWAEGQPGEGATFHVLLPAE
jgi:PAS domain S-box-containing protein